MTKHGYAPAPWSVSCSSSLGVKIYKPIREGFGQGICRVQELGHMANPFNDEVMANARLIAAAPELLEALENVCTELMAIGGYIPEDKWGTAHNTANKALDEARQAVEKALGKG